MHGKSIEVPDLVNYHYNDLDTVLQQDSQFTIQIADSTFSKGVRAGIILEQNPPAKATVKQGRKIYLTLAAKDPPKVTMPNLVDMSLRQASSLLETFGLEVGSLKYQPDLCVNCILAQEINGEQVMKGSKVPSGAAIDLVVGKGFGDELVMVPYLKNMSVEFAKVLLQSSSLNIGIVLPDETINTEEDSLNAKIYNYIPNSQEEPSLRMGSSVDLYITLDTTKVHHSLQPDSL